jgi:hypothetical protein
MPLGKYMLIRFAFQPAAVILGLMCAAHADAQRSVISCEWLGTSRSLTLELDNQQQQAIAYFSSIPTPQRLTTRAWNENRLVVKFDVSGAQYSLDRHTGTMEMVDSMNSRSYFQCRPSKPIM